MAIDVVSVQYKGGLLFDIILLTQCHEEVLVLQPTIPPKRFDIFYPDWGDAQKVYREMRSDFSLKTKKIKWHWQTKIPGGYKFAPLVTNQLWRANQHEHACFGLSFP